MNTNTNTNTYTLGYNHMVPTRPTAPAPAQARPTESPIKDTTVFLGNMHEGKKAGSGGTAAAVTSCWRSCTHCQIPRFDTSLMQDCCDRKRILHAWKRGSRLLPSRRYWNRARAVYACDTIVDASYRVHEVAGTAPPDGDLEISTIQGVAVVESWGAGCTRSAAAKRVGLQVLNADRGRAHMVR